jgi:hypothetical protein
MRDGVRDGEDSSSEDTTQQHVIGKHESRRYFSERQGDEKRKQACWGR